MRRNIPILTGATQGLKRITQRCSSPERCKHTQNKRMDYEEAQRHEDMDKDKDMDRDMEMTVALPGKTSVPTRSRGFSQCHRKAR
jgi:hypothetical protein